MSLGTYLKELRDKKSILKSATLDDVSEATNISTGLLSLIENGHVRSPSADKLYRLAKYYGVPVHKLIDQIEV